MISTLTLGNVPRCGHYLFVWSNRAKGVYTSACAGTITFGSVHKLRIGSRRMREFSETLAYIRKLWL